MTDKKAKPRTMTQEQAATKAKPKAKVAKKQPVTPKKRAPTRKVAKPAAPTPPPKARAPKKPRTKADAEREIAQAKRRGRPKGDTYTKVIADEIINRLIDGEPLAVICRDDHMPNPSTVYDWIDREEHAEFSQRFARARNDGGDRIATDCLGIADDATNDWMEKIGADGQSEGWKLNGEHVQRSKLRIETRMKLLAKWYPGRYGEQINLNHGTQAADPIRKLIEAASGTSLKPKE